MSRFHLIAMLVAVAIGVAPTKAQDQLPTKPIRIVLAVPSGSDPPLTDHLIGAVPPVSTGCWLYGTVNSPWAGLKVSPGAAAGASYVCGRIDERRHH